MLISDDKAMRAFGARLLSACTSGGIVKLHGNLGAGKTTLVRGALESMRVTNGVRSPTYTLIEFYPFVPLSIAHLDLYRLSGEEELEYLGFRDYLNDETICFIEWPERAGNSLSNTGLAVFLEYDPNGRRVRMTSENDWGRAIINSMQLL